MSAHGALLALVWVAVAIVVAAVVAVVWARIDALWAARRSDEQRRATVLKRLARTAPWVTLRQDLAPHDLGDVDVLAREAGFRVLGIERSRGLLRRPLLVFVPLRGQAAEMLAEPAAGAVLRR